MDIVVFPDTEEAVRTALEDGFEDEEESASVHCSIPTPRPARFVTVQRTGGVAHDMVVDGALLTIEAWTALPSEALALLQLARGIIHSLPGTTISGVPVYRTEEAGGPVNLPDPDSTQSRYTMTVRLDVRGSAL